jgi:hypothetical protein
VADGSEAERHKAKRPRRSTAALLAAGGKSRAKAGAMVTLPVAAVEALAATAVREEAASLARARPVWTPDRLRAACSSMAEGIPFKTAAWAAGASPDALHALMGRDEVVRDAVETARAVAHERLLREMLADETGKTVNARTWLLERLDPQGFRPAPVTIDNTHAGPKGSDINIVLSPGDVRQLAKGKP